MDPDTPGSGSYHMRHERLDHTLQPPALVHEVYLRLAHQNVEWQGRSHFICVAARQIRRVLVYCYLELERYQDALNTLLESQDIKIALKGKNSVTAAVGYHNIAKALGGLGRLDESLETHRKAITISTELNGGDAIRTLVFRGSYGMALAGAERYEEAQAELTVAYDGLKAGLGDDNFRTRKLATELAGLYRAWGKEDEARLYEAPVD